MKCIFPDVARVLPDTVWRQGIFLDEIDLKRYLWRQQILRDIFDVEEFPSLFPALKSQGKEQVNKQIKRPII